MRRIIGYIRRWRLVEHGKNFAKEIIVAAIISIVTTILVLIVTSMINEKFYVNVSLEKYAKVSGSVDGERIFIYSGGEINYDPSVEMSVTNTTGFTIDIKSIGVEVLEYRSMDDFTVELPAGGGDEKFIYSWKCRISDELREYEAIYRSKEGDSDEKYIAVESGDSGEFIIVVCPEKPGMYTIKIHTNYTFKDKIKTDESKVMKFIYDPNHEIKG